MPVANSPMLGLHQHAMGFEFGIRGLLPLQTRTSSAEPFSQANFSLFKSVRNHTYCSVLQSWLTQVSLQSLAWSSPESTQSNLSPGDWSTSQGASLRDWASLIWLGLNCFRGFRLTSPLCFLTHSLMSWYPGSVNHVVSVSVLFGIYIILSLELWACAMMFDF